LIPGFIWLVARRWTSRNRFNTWLASTRRAHRAFRPPRGVNLPRVGKHEHRYLTHEQVDDLATATGYPAHASKHTA
jgi:hypothetical protein